MHPAKDDHVRRRLRCLTGEPEGITNEIGDVLNLRALVVVSEDDRVALSSELLDFSLQFRDELVPREGCGRRCGCGN